MKTTKTTLKVFIKEINCTIEAHQNSIKKHPHLKDYYSLQIATLKGEINAYQYLIDLK